MNEPELPVIEPNGEPCIEHKWTGAHSGAPGEPVEWVEYCDVCGIERGGSYE